MLSVLFYRNTVTYRRNVTVSHYDVNLMGRPPIHDEKTRAELLAAAERLVAEGGIEAVSIRAAAERAGTTTRAVYALFGSKEGLVQALSQRAFGLLMERVVSLPPSDDPGRDLITAGVDGFRTFALEHPDLFRLFFTAPSTRPALSADATETRVAALGALIRLVERADDAGLLGRHSVADVTLMWDAACTGLAMRETCGPIEHSHGRQIWTDMLTALLTGFSGLAEVHATHAEGRSRPVTRRLKRPARST